jgi:enediyne biosynthesis protein CalE5
MESDQEILNRWSASAPFWEKHRDVIRQMFAPVTQALAADSGIGAGSTVLDIATGPGEPAASIAAMAGPQGKVIGLDPVPEMVAVARRSADRLGLKNTRFEVGFPEHLPFEPATFDAVISRFGVMFFQSPGEAVREMLRVLKPGKKLALAVWHFAETNPFFYAVQRVIDRYAAPAPPPEPDAPDAFRFASPGKLKEILAEAGAAAPTERLLQFKIEAPISAEEFWMVRCEMSERLREKLSHFSKEQLSEVRREAIEALGEYSSGGAIRFPAEVLIVSGSRAAR